MAQNLPMAQRIPITDRGPRLQGVFGPIPVAEERELRGLLLSVRDAVVALDYRLSGRVRPHNHVLELSWSPLGLLTISSDVAAVDSSNNSVTFEIELRPGWYFEDSPDPATWTVETSVHADCLHTIDCEAMETVFHREVEARSPREAVNTLVEEVERLVEMATTRSVDSWTDMTRD